MKPLLTIIGRSITAVIFSSIAAVIFGGTRMEGFMLGMLMMAWMDINARIDK